MYSHLSSNNKQKNQRLTVVKTVICPDTTTARQRIPDEVTVWVKQDCNPSHHPARNSSSCSSAIKCCTQKHDANQRKWYRDRKWETEINATLATFIFKESIAPSNIPTVWLRGQRAAAKQTLAPLCVATQSNNDALATNFQSRGNEIQW